MVTENDWELNIFGNTQGPHGVYYAGVFLWIGKSSIDGSFSIAMFNSPGYPQILHYSRQRRPS